MALILDGSAGITFPSGSVQNNAVANNAAITALVGSRGLSNTIVPAGSVLQVVVVNFATQVSFTTQDTETYIFQASITPTFATSKILAIAAIGGISNSGNGRMSGRLRWNTTSGDVSGTQIAGLTQVALPGAGIANLAGEAMTGLTSAVGSTSTQYIKVTFTHGDTSGTCYVCQYGSESQLTLMEIAQ